MADDDKVPPLGPVGATVRSGTWLYDGSVPARVRIRLHSVRYGSGDYQDALAIAEDQPVECFYVEWDASGGGRTLAIGGPFETLEDAERYVAEQTGGTAIWES